MKTENEEPKSPRQETATEETTEESFPDPNFPIEATGGPSDGSGGSHTVPPPRDR